MLTELVRPPRQLLRSILLLLLLLPILGFAQTFDYGNAWYNPNTTYLRLKVAENGIYRITPQLMLSAGFDTVGVNPGNLHLLYRGLEEYVHVEPGTSGTWQYLEFYGRRNDGGLDTLMYIDKRSRLYDGESHPNPSICTFSDTSIYYLYADNVPGLRMQVPNLASVPPPVIHTEIPRTSYLEFHPSEGYTMNVGSLYFGHTRRFNPHWTPGEGYAGLNFGMLTDAQVKIPTPWALNTAPAQLHYRLISLDLEQTGFTISVDGNFLSQVIADDAGVYPGDTLILTPLADSVDVRIQGMSTSSTPMNYDFLSLVGITYPGETRLDGGASISFPRNNATDEYYMFHDIAPGGLGLAYDLVNHVRVADTVHADSLGIWVPGNAVPGLMWVSSDAGIRTPIVAPAPPAHNLSATTNAADLVLITSRDLASSAAAYASYRQGSAVNPLVVKIAYVDEIYEEFGHGVSHPMAIKRFCKFAMDQWAVTPSHFLIWGEGNTDIRSMGSGPVPLYGNPGCDLMYVTNFDNDSVDSHMSTAIGRVPIDNDAEGLTYIDKLNLYENMPTAPWMRNGLFVDGSSDTIMYDVLPLQMDEHADAFAASPVHGRPSRYSYLNLTEMSGATVPFAKALERGASVTHLLAPDAIHSALPSIDTVANDSLLTFIMGQAAFLGNVQDTGSRPGVEWLLAQNRGAIGMIAHTDVAFSGPMYLFSSVWGSKANIPNNPLSLGTIMAQSVDSLAEMSAFIIPLPMLYLGDPSVHLRTGEFAVWPGDADDDFIANNADLLAIGLAYGDTGFVRANATLNWAAQPATPWDSTFANGVNHVHADCNGDGLVDDNDTLAIVQNYGLTHNKTIGLLTGTENDPVLAIEAEADTIQDSSGLVLTVRLGSQQLLANEVYGIAWSIYYDPMLVDSASLVVDYDSCWLGTPGQDMLTLTRHLHSLGRIDMAITRTDHQAISGEGILAKLGIVVIDNISGKLPGDTTMSPLHFIPADARMINATGSDLPLQGLSKDMLVLGVVPEPQLDAKLGMLAFPNPAKDEIYVQTRDESDCTVEIMDVQGRLRISTEFHTGESKQLGVGDLTPGLYMVRVTNAEGTFTQKLMKLD